MHLIIDAFASPVTVVARGEFMVVHQKMHRFSRNAWEVDISKKPCHDIQQAEIAACKRDAARVDCMQHRPVTKAVRRVRYNWTSKAGLPAADPACHKLQARFHIELHS